MLDFRKPYKKGITFGAFDPLHYGHIRLLKRAKAQCYELIVVVSTDAYIKLHKNRNPRIEMLERIEDLKGIKYVDRVYVQGGYNGSYTTKEILVNELKPDVIFVGDDWTPETFTGEGLGVPVVYLPRTEEISSTKIWPTKE